MNLRRKFVLAVAAVTVGLVPGSGRAQSARAVGPTPPRLAFIDGEVSFWRPGAEDWAPAQVNTALAAGDSLFVAEGGNAEIEIGSRAYVRAGSGTQLAIASLETGYLQLEVTSGHAAIDLARIPEGQEIEVDSPSGAFTIARAGYYRIDVDDDTTFTTRNGGVATVVPGGGESTDVGHDRQVVLQGTDNVTVSVNPAPAPDNWDRWNTDRTGRHPERPRGAEYVAPPVAGIDDLDGAGDWSDTPDYGHVWVPRDVPDDWAPYSAGRWTWDPYYEWTWVDDAPWGWAPYHYGRWCRVHDRWGWAPGPIVAAPVYSPALVTFFGGGGVSVSVGAPFVSWVALGWGEPILPWWGPVGFHGRPYWGGWGGPRVVNNVVINNTTIVDARNINRFSNVDVRNAVVGVSRDHFGRGRVEHIRITNDQARQLQPLRGSVGVRPVPASLVPNVGHAQRPPDRVQARRVVATRPPQDPTPRLRAAGLEPRGPMHHPEVRVMAPTRGPRGQGQGGGAEHGAQPERAGRPEQAGRPAQGGSLAPSGGGRMVAPPPPGHEGGVERGAPGARDNRPGHGPNGELGGHAVPPAPPPTEGNPPAKGDHVNERRGRNVDHTRPEAPSGAIPPPAHERGHQATPRERTVQPPPPPRQHPAEGHVPPSRGPAEQAAPPAHRGSERPAPPAHEERVMPPAREQHVAPPAREQHVAPPVRQNPSAPPPQHSHDRPDARVAPPVQRSAPPAHQRVERPAPERPAPPAPPPPQGQRQAPKAPNAPDHGRHRDDAKQPNAQ